jgi:outer membrane protein assembly factor BamB
MSLWAAVNLPVVDAFGGIYFVADSWLMRIQPNGSLHWQRYMSGMSTDSGAALAGDKLIFRDDTGRVTAYNPLNGSVLWTATSTSASSIVRPFLIGSVSGNIFALNATGSLLTLSTANGAVLSQRKLLRCNAAHTYCMFALGSDDTVYYTNRSMVFKVEGSVESTLGSGATAPVVYNNAALGIDTILSVTTSSSLACYGSDGAALWTVQLPYRSNTVNNGTALPAITTDGSVVVVDLAGFCHKLDATTGQLLWKISVVSNGIAIVPPVVGGDGSIYLYTQSQGSPWSTANLSALHSRGSLRWVDNNASRSWYVPLPPLAIGPSNELVVIDGRGLVKYAVVQPSASPTPSARPTIPLTATPSASFNALLVQRFAGQVCVGIPVSSSYQFCECIPVSAGRLRETPRLRVCPHFPICIWFALLCRWVVFWRRNGPL